MPHFKATAFRLSPEELELMDALATKVGVISRAEVLRVAIRKLARLEGLQLPPPRKKRASSSLEPFRMTFTDEQSAQRSGDE